MKKKNIKSKDTQAIITTLKQEIKKLKKKNESLFNENTNLLIDLIELREELYDNE